MIHRFGDDPELIFDPSNNRLLACDYPGEPYAGEGQLPRIVKRIPSRQFADQYETGLRQLLLTVTERCNLRCDYCPHTTEADGNRPHSNTDMDPAVAAAAVRYFLDHSENTAIPTISFFGGEPLLNRAAIDAAVAEAKDRPEVQFVIDTNGLLLDDETCRWCWDSGFSMQVSLDGPEWINDRYRGKGTFAKVMAGAERWFALDPEGERWSWSATIAPPYPIAEVAEFLDGQPGMANTRLVTLGGSDINPEIDVLGHVWHEARDTYVAAAHAGKLEQVPPGLRSLFDKPLIRFHNRSQGPCTERPIGGCCIPGVLKLHVTVDGRFQPCEKVGEDLFIGDVSSGIDLEACDELDRRMYEARPDCDSCWASRLCSLCYQVLAVDGKISGATCAEERRRAENRARLYTELWDIGSYRTMLEKSTNL